MKDFRSVAYYERDLLALKLKEFAKILSIGDEVFEDLLNSRWV